jgi:hypothetical protein
MDQTMTKQRSAEFSPPVPFKNPSSSRTAGFFISQIHILIQVAA